MLRKLALVIMTMIIAFGNTKADEKLIELDVNKIPEWMTERIDKELHSFKDSGISQKELENLKDLIRKANLPIMHFEIIDNKLYHGNTPNLSGRNLNALTFVKNELENRVLKKYSLANISFFINLEDDDRNLYTATIKYKNFPIFVFAKDKMQADSDRHILFPDDYTIANRGYGYWEGWEAISKRVLKYNDKYHWQSKRELVFWRGKKSDYFEVRTFQTPRQTIVDLSDKYPNLIDAKFHVEPTVASNKFITKFYSIRDLIMKKFGIGGFVKNEEFHKYKMLINIDGATSTFPGFLQRLLTSSVTIKQETDNEQWFYDAVKPWVHYVPVKKDLSDLIEKIEWVKNNDAEAKKIADRSTEFVQNNLMMDHIDIYIVALLTEYAKLQQFKLEKATIENVQ